ncbi:hypothetical protein ACIBEJ_49505 [Nonomuraea sp. NPDC050790]|uniref:hypothetical protein n=1 Tax=Nonomuraea sp. NPDC050790 TaxID=3364371 RepID=UPI003795151A
MLRLPGRVFFVCVAVAVVVVVTVIWPAWATPLGAAVGVAALLYQIARDGRKDQD